MFSVFACILGAAVIAVSVAPYFLRTRRALTAVLITDLALLAAGVGCLMASVLTVRGTLANAALDSEYRAWAWDVYKLWVRGAGITAAVPGVIALVAAWARHPWRRVRNAVTAAVSILLLVVGGVYVLIAENGTADLVTPAWLWTFGCAALVLAGAAVDAAHALREKIHEEKRKAARRRRKK